MPVEFIFRGEVFAQCLTGKDNFNSLGTDEDMKADILEEWKRETES